MKAMSKSAKKPVNSAISIQGVSKKYRIGRTGAEKLALDNINLEIPKGSFFGLLGPNGAGKSTLINIIADLVVKTTGKIYIEGLDTDTDRQASKFHIGVVPQELVLDPFFNVREMLETYAGYYGVPKSKRRTDEILQALSLTDKASVNARRLSGGMKRRVLIGKALVHNPSILILDEPTAGVDVELRYKLWDYVRELNARGTTVLLTTHYLEEAEELCDHIAIINQGRIIAHDRTENLLTSFDTKEIIFHFTKPLTKIPAALKKFSPSRVRTDSLQFTYCAKAGSLHQFIQTIMKTGLIIRDISTDEPKLEDVFRNLIMSATNAKHAA